MTRHGSLPNCWSACLPRSQRRQWTTDAICLSCTHAYATWSPWQSKADRCAAHCAGSDPVLDVVGSGCFSLTSSVPSSAERSSRKSAAYHCNCHRLGARAACLMVSDASDRTCRFRPVQKVETGTYDLKAAEQLGNSAEPCRPNLLVVAAIARQEKDWNRVHGCICEHEGGSSISGSQGTNDDDRQWLHSAHGRSAPGSGAVACASAY